jgi:phage I-like protein
VRRRGGDDSDPGDNAGLSSDEQKAAKAVGCSFRDFAAAKESAMMPTYGHVKAAFKGH